jgi:hypothetical protein
VISPSAPRGSLRRGAAVAALAVALAFAGLLLAAPIATADGCAPTDLSCATESVGGAVDQAKEQAGNAGNTVNDTANDAAGKVSDSVDGVLNPGGGGPGDGGGGPGDGGGSGGGPGAGGSGHGGQRSGSGHGGRSGPGATAQAGNRARSTIGSPTRARTHDVSSITIPPATSVLGRRYEDRAGISRAVQDIALHVGLPLLLLLALSAGFVAIQDRLDRTDPKLALAPVDRDELTFQ